MLHTVDTQLPVHTQCCDLPPSGVIQHKHCYISIYQADVWYTVTVVTVGVTSVIISCCLDCSQKNLSFIDWKLWKLYLDSHTQLILPMSCIIHIHFDNGFIQMCDNIGLWQPELSSYSKNEEGELFEKKWYEYNPWLEYFPSADVMYCFSCPFFPK